MDTVEETTRPLTKPAKSGKFTREMIRDAILDSKGEIETVTCFGIEVDIRTPALEDLVQYRNAENDDTVMARAIVNLCWVPLTEEKVFDEADVDSLMKLKYTKDMKKLVGAVNSVLGGDEAIQKKVEEESFRN